MKKEKVYKIGDTIQIQEKYRNEIFARFDDIRSLEGQIESLSMSAHNKKIALWRFIENLAFGENQNKYGESYDHLGNMLIITKVNTVEETRDADYYRNIQERIESAKKQRP